MNKKEVATAFEGKILGIRNYKSDQQVFMVHDFQDIRMLRNILDEIFTGESDITPAGKVFLEKYHGFKELSDKISSDGEFALEGHQATSEEILRWLEELIPMEIISFIEEARGNIQPGTALRSDLLPPDKI
jgi:hypothetical protein